MDSPVIEHSPHLTESRGRPLCVHLLPETAAAGAENQAYVLLRELCERGDVDLELVCFAEGSRHRDFQALGFPIHVIGRRRRLSLDFPRRVRALRRLYTERAPAILHTWLFEAHVVGLAAARRWPDSRVVLAQRSGVVQRTMPAHMSAVRALASRADFAISNSPEGAEILGEVGISPNRVILTQQGIAPERVAVRRSPVEIRERLGLAAGSPLVVAVGRAHSDKDFPGLLRAMGGVWERRAEVRLAMVGPTEHDLTSLGVEMPSRATATGWDDNPADYLNAADVVVVSSWTEGYSNVAAEALVLGRPVVTTDTGAHPPLVAESGGRVVPVRRPDLLAEGILAMLDQPPATERIVEVARRNLSVAAVADLTLAVYGHLLNGV
jgi:glycosyltransferase involved in cell wall biosynthesis